MNGRTRLFASPGLRACSLAFTFLVLGCSDQDFATEPVAEMSLAVNACNEEVPSERYVDGLPAYAQCDGVSSGSIWSNNGIDTSTTSLGDDWIQTQRGGGYQCTEWSYRYMRFRWGIHYRHGDAQEWCDGELPDGLVKSTTPVHGDLIIFAGGVCGADESTGHIAVIDTVDDAAQRVTFVEQNRAGRRSANQSCATCFLHAVANDGSSGGAGGMGAAGSAGSGVEGGAAGVGGSIGMGGTPGVGGAVASGGNGVGGTMTASGGAPAAGTGGSAGTAGATQGTAGVGNVGTGGSVASGGAGGGSNAGGASPGEGGSGGTTAAAGAPPVTSAGAAGAAALPSASDDAFAEPADSGCSVARPSSSEGNLAWMLALLLGGVVRRRRS